MSELVEKSMDVSGEASEKSEQPEFCLDCNPADDGAAGPAERVVYPADVVEILPEDDSVYVVGTKDGKVTKIGGLEGMENLKFLILRSCLVSSMAGVENLVKLEKLELYDNQLERVSHIERLSHLRILDLSFNAIREMIPLAVHVPLLEELYMAQNKLKDIVGLEGLTELRVLDLGANRFREIKGLSTNTKLKSLWLGKNKIEEIAGLESLVNLEQLDIQNNRLTSLGNGLRSLSKLRELYLACNRIPNVTGLPSPVSSLETLDLSSNGVTGITGIEEHQNLQEMWMSSSQLSNFDDLLPLTHLPKLECLYLEHSPLAKDFEYRLRTTRMLPSLVQLDATNVNRAPVVAAPVVGKFGRLASADKAKKEVVVNGVVVSSAAAAAAANATNENVPSEEGSK
jgi:protein phosphatase 1 regulatory subunit 7